MVNGAPLLEDEQYSEDQDKITSNNDYIFEVFIGSHIVDCQTCKDDLPCGILHECFEEYTETASVIQGLLR